MRFGRSYFDKIPTSIKAIDDLIRFFCDIMLTKNGKKYLLYFFFYNKNITSKQYTKSLFFFFFLLILKVINVIKKKSILIFTYYFKIVEKYFGQLIYMKTGYWFILSELVLDLYFTFYDLIERFETKIFNKPRVLMKLKLYKQHWNYENMTYEEMEKYDHELYRYWYHNLGFDDPVVEKTYYFLQKIALYIMYPFNYYLVQKDNMFFLQFVFNKVHVFSLELFNMSFKNEYWYSYFYRFLNISWISKVIYKWSYLNNNNMYIYYVYFYYIYVYILWFDLVFLWKHKSILIYYYSSLYLVLLDVFCIRFIIYRVIKNNLIFFIKYIYNNIYNTIYFIYLKILYVYKIIAFKIFQFYFIFKKIIYFFRYIIFNRLLYFFFICFILINLNLDIIYNILPEAFKLALLILFQIIEYLYLLISQSIYDLNRDSSLVNVFFIWNYDINYYYQMFWYFFDETVIEWYLYYQVDVKKTLFLQFIVKYNKWRLRHPYLYKFGLLGWYFKSRKRHYRFHLIFYVWYYSVPASFQFIAKCWIFLLFLKIYSIFQWIYWFGFDSVMYYLYINYTSIYNILYYYIITIYIWCKYLVIYGLHIFCIIFLKLWIIANVIGINLIYYSKYIENVIFNLFFYKVFWFHFFYDVFALISLVSYTILKLIGIIVFQLWIYLQLFLNIIIKYFALNHIQLHYENVQYFLSNTFIYFFNPIIDSVQNFVHFYGDFGKAKSGNSGSLRAYFERKYWKRVYPSRKFFTVDRFLSTLAFTSYTQFLELSMFQISNTFTWRYVYLHLMYSWISFYLTMQILMFFFKKYKNIFKDRMYDYHSNTFYSWERICSHYDKFSISEHTFINNFNLIFTFNSMDYLLNTKDRYDAKNFKTVTDLVEYVYNRLLDVISKDPSRFKSAFGLNYFILTRYIVKRFLKYRDIVSTMYKDYIVLFKSEKMMFLNFKKTLWLPTYKYNITSSFNWITDLTSKYLLWQQYLMPFLFNHMNAKSILYILNNKIRFKKDYSQLFKGYQFFNKTIEVDFSDFLYLDPDFYLYTFFNFTKIDAEFINKTKQYNVLSEFIWSRMDHDIIFGETFAEVSKVHATNFSTVSNYLEWVRNISFYYFNNNVSFMGTTFLNVFKVVKTFVTAEMIKSRINVYNDFLWNVDSLSNSNFHMFNATMMDRLFDYHPLILEEALYAVVDATRNEEEKSVNLLQQTEAQELDLVVWCFLIPFVSICLMTKWNGIWWNHSKILTDLTLYLVYSLQFLFSFKWFLIFNSDHGFKAGARAKTYRLWSESKIMSKQWLESYNIYFYAFLNFFYLVTMQSPYMWMYYLYLYNIFDVFLCFSFSSMLIVSISYMFCKFKFLQDIR
jgi:hypothetical protein